VDGRYSVELPWKNDNKSDITLSSNFQIAKQRLSSCFNNLMKTNLLSEYNHIFKDQLAKDIIETAPDQSSGSLVHYLAHSPVFRPLAESTKVRIVFDASSKSSKQKLSLNDC
jgi:hypothetical protein